MPLRAVLVMAPFMLGGAAWMAAGWFSQLRRMPGALTAWRGAFVFLCAAGAYACSAAAIVAGIVLTPLGYAGFVGYLAFCALGAALVGRWTGNPRRVRAARTETRERAGG